MNNRVALRLLLIIFTPLLVITLSYFLFLSKPDLFSKILERYKYKDFSFFIGGVSTNKNPLYPEIIFRHASLQTQTENIKIDEIKIGLNLLGYIFDSYKRINYLKIYASQISTDDYISLLPEDSEDLKNTLSELIDEGYVEELYFEFIDGGEIRVNNEILISDVVLNIGPESNLNARKAFVTANSKEVKIILKKGSYDNLPFENISGLFDPKLRELQYTSYHKSINEYAEDILPLGVLNFKNDIQLFTSGFINFEKNENKNYGFISFQDLSEIKYLEDGFKVKTNIFIEDFSNVFSQNFISFNDI